MALDAIFNQFEIFLGPAPLPGPVQAKSASRAWIQNSADYIRKKQLLKFKSLKQRLPYSDLHYSHLFVGADGTLQL